MSADIEARRRRVVAWLLWMFPKSTDAELHRMYGFAALSGNPDVPGSTPAEISKTARAVRAEPQERQP